MAECVRQQLPVPPVVFVLTLSAEELNTVLCALAGKTSPAALEVYRVGYTAMYQDWAQSFGGAHDLKGGR